jgi:hypothetical protein
MFEVRECDLVGACRVAVFLGMRIEAKIMYLFIAVV